MPLKRNLVCSCSDSFALTLKDFSERHFGLFPYIVLNHFLEEVCDQISSCEVLAKRFIYGCFSAEDTSWVISCYLKASY